MSRDGGTTAPASIESDQPTPPDSLSLTAKERAMPWLLPAAQRRARLRSAERALAFQGRIEGGDR